MADESSDSISLEFTPTWVVAVVCFIIILISLCAARGLHHLGKWLEQRDKYKSLFEALQKLKEELMLLGFISLLLTVFQDAISHICIPSYLASLMLPCNKETVSHTKFSLQAINIRRQLLSTDTGSEHCSKGRVPFLSLEALHQLHIFIFVLAVVHVIFCVITMILGGAKISQWKHWENSVRNEPSLGKASSKDNTQVHHNLLFLSKRAIGYWRKSAVVSWLISFFKQFYNSVTKSDYIALREGFITAHCPGNKKFNFHEYMMKIVEGDFKKVVGISWYLWLFVVIFLLLNLRGWHTYFWLAFLPLILLLLVGAKLEHIITRLAQDVDQNKKHNQTRGVRPSDEYFWFGRPGIVLHLIHFILFQNSFEIAFFVWIWCTYGFRSCIMEKLGYIIPRIVIGVIVQFLCSYSTLPLYAIVTQMGSKFREEIFDDFVKSSLYGWVESTRGSGGRSKSEDTVASETQMQKMTRESYKHVQVVEEMVVIEAGTTSITELPFVSERPPPSP